jgi:hypothetical protein
VPNIFRTTLNVFIVLPSKPIWRASSMPWLSKRVSPVDCELDGRRDPNGYEGITWAATTTPWSDRPVFGNIRYMSFASTTTIRFPEIHRPDRKPREGLRSHSLSSRGTLIKFLYRNCASGNFGVLYEALLHADKLFTELPASSADIRRSHNVDSN